jgi:replicative DNA helicase
LAKEIKCPVIALAQLNRSADGRRPTIADIRDSGNIEQDADLILLLHRESDQPEDAQTSTTANIYSHAIRSVDEKAAEVMKGVLKMK